MSYKIKSASFGYNNWHHLLEVKEVPSSFSQLRRELQLPAHRDILNYMMKGKDFEACIGNLAEKLNILLDGDYEPEALFDMLLTSLKKRGVNSTKPWLNDKRLQDVELVEREGDITVESGIGGTEVSPKDAFSIFMKEQNCQVCENTALCKSEGKCQKLGTGRFLN